jgi:alkylglycerol monooxygenase
MAINFIALSVPVFFLLIGVELLVARRRGLRLYRFDDAITDLGCGIGQQVVGVFLKGALLAGYVYVSNHFAVVSWASRPWVSWAIAFVGVDLLYYWWHRASHEVAFMWAVHVVHHQSEDYNLAVALRQAWFSGATSWAFYLPLAVLGVPPVVFVTVYAFSTLYQFWIHTRAVGKLGPVEWVLNTASHHRVHHGRNPKYLDKNYAATLIVWDRLFGSFEDEDEEPYYGVVAPYASRNPVWANFDGWAHLARRARRASRLADKIRVFVKPPGWTAPGETAHDPEAFSAEPPVRFETATPRGLAAYVLAQFAVVVPAAVVLMLDDVSRRPSAVAVALAAFVLATTVGWGALFERRSWAVAAEVARLAVTAVAAAVAFWAGAASAGALVASLVFASGSCAWLFALRARVAAAREEAAVAA